MAFTSIGDLARQFSSLHHISSTRSRLDLLADELASGRVSDPAKRLSGRTDLLADASHRVALLDAGLSATNGLLRRFETAQTALDQVDEQRAILSKQLLALPPAVTPQMFIDSATRAEGAFAAVVSALGARHGAETLFSGHATDQAALAAPETILAALRAHAATATDVADLLARVDDFFDAPGGLFETIAYLGDDGPAPTRRLGGRDVEIGPRADDPALRMVMKGLGLAVVAASYPAGISDMERVTLMQQAGAILVEAADPLAGVRGGLGTVQEQAEITVSRQSAALTAARIQHHDLVAANPEETAVALREAQLQLETQFAVTARLAGLSLAGYLR